MLRHVLVRGWRIMVSAMQRHVTACLDIGASIQAKHRLLHEMLLQHSLLELLVAMLQIASVLFLPLAQLLVFGFQYPQPELQQLVVVCQLGCTNTAACFLLQPRLQ